MEIWQQRPHHTTCLFRKIVFVKDVCTQRPLKTHLWSLHLRWFLMVFSITASFARAGFDTLVVTGFVKDFDINVQIFKIE